MTPDEVRLRRFDLVRRGCNPAAVQRFQEEVADELHNWEKRVASLEVQCAELIESMPDASEVEAEAKAAEAWRDEVLADLNRRRVELNAEIVRMRAGRDVLQKAIEETLEVLESPLGKLVSALKDARFQGDLEAERVRDARRPSSAEMRAELETARLAGFVPSASSPKETDTPSSGEFPEQGHSPSVAAGLRSSQPSVKPLDANVQADSSPPLSQSSPSPPPLASRPPLSQSSPSSTPPSPRSSSSSPSSTPSTPPPQSSPPASSPSPSASKPLSSSKPLPSSEISKPPAESADSSHAEQDKSTAATNLDQLFAKAREELSDEDEDADKT